MTMFMNLPTWVRATIVVTVIALVAVVAINLANRSESAVENNVGVVTPPVDPTAQPTAPAPTTPPVDEPTPTQEPVEPIEVPEGQDQDSYYGDDALAAEELVAAQNVSIDAVHNYYAVSATESVEARTARLTPFFTSESGLATSTPIEGELYDASSGATIDIVANVALTIPLASTATTYSVMVSLDMQMLISPPTDDADERPWMMRGTEQTEIHVVKVGDKWLVDQIIVKESAL